jgi:predicted benzoate:H+ symporter BenE
MKRWQTSKRWPEKSKCLFVRASRLQYEDVSFRVLPITEEFVKARQGATFRITPREFSGALADLGTLIPLALGAIAVAGLAPAPVLAAFGIFYIATALVYRLPIPVQPMKAIAALAMTGAVTPSMLAVSGVITGAILLALGLSGLITRFARIVPQSVVAGLQLGLGVSLAGVAVNLMAEQALVAAAVLAVLSLVLLAPRLPVALLAVAAAVAMGALAGAEGASQSLTGVSQISLPGWPSLGELEGALSQLVLPQMALTLTNAVLLTSLLASDYFGEQAAHATPRRLAVTSGLANIVLAPLGALPMCHGAGGLAAHHRFGARTGAAPLALGLALVALALAPGGLTVAVLSAIPLAGLGALLFVAAVELALSRRLFDSRPSCWPVIAVTALVTVALDPFWGLLAGGVCELIRMAAVRAIFGHRAR